MATTRPDSSAELALEQLQHAAKNKIKLALIE
jgi:hypothetical protein